MEQAEVMPATAGEKLRRLALNWKTWVVLVGAGVLGFFLINLGEVKTASTLGDAVDLFKCCILTWKAVVIVLPAFVAAGAVVTFVPDSAVMRYLGRRTAKWKSYGIASTTGMILSVCSCNVVPIFMGILRRGAGLGPAYCFVYAAPAISLITMIMTFQVIGPYMAGARIIATAIIAITAGLLMSLFFRREDAKRAQAASPPAALESLALQPDHAGRKALALVALILSVLIFGAWDGLGGWLRNTVGGGNAGSVDWNGLGIGLRMFGGLAVMALAAVLAIRWFSKEEAVEWARQTGYLLRTVLPIFIPAVLVIGVIVNHIPIHWIMPSAANKDAFVFGHPNGNHYPQVLVSTLFGGIMYFPLLTEVAFVKGMLKHDLAIGPALAILLAGPGLSLPGLLLLNKVVGLRKTVVYFVIMVILVSGISYAFGQAVGPYQCVCRQMKPTL